MESENTNKASIFQDDEPKCLKDDDFDFKHQAWRIANLVAGKNAMNHATVGLSGAWGTGKSSMLKMVQEILQKCDEKNEYLVEYPIINDMKPVIVWFDPWFFGNESEVILTFFIKLAKELYKQNHPAKHTLAKLFISLGKWIDPLTDILESTEISLGPIKTNVGKATKTLTKKLSNFSEYLEKGTFDDFFDIKDQIKNITVSSKDKIVILIDDLDRLNIDETITMLKIIRLITEFDNINVVVAFDMETTSQLIKAKCGYKNGSEYLNKMFNVQINVSSIKKTIIHHNFFKEIIMYYYTNNSDVIDAILSKIDSVRIAKKLLNMYSVGVAALDGVIDKFDYFCLCALFMFCTKYYYGLTNINTDYNNLLVVINFEQLQQIYEHPISDRRIIMCSYENMENEEQLAYIIFKKLFFDINGFKETGNFNELTKNKHRLMMMENFHHYFGMIR